jgi:hypothetical protein
MTEHGGCCELCAKLMKGFQLTESQNNLLEESRLHFNIVGRVTRRNPTAKSSLHPLKGVLIFEVEGKHARNKL